MVCDVWCCCLFRASCFLFVVSLLVCCALSGVRNTASIVEGLTNSSNQPAQTASPPAAAAAAPSLFTFLSLHPSIHPSLSCSSHFLSHTHIPSNCQSINTHRASPAGHPPSSSSQQPPQSSSSLGGGLGLPGLQNPNPAGQQAGGLNPAAAPKGMGLAQKLLEKMGWREGQGLGRNRQGMATPLVAQKTAAHAGG